MEKYIINPITGDKILSTEFIVNDYYKIKEENKQLKKEIKQFKKNLREKLIKYFDIEKDCYFYCLTRDKSAFQYGTMSFEDFKEFDIEQIDDIINFLLNERSDK